MGYSQDISFCADKECPYTHLCRRADQPTIQYYFVMMESPRDGKDCDMFYANSDTATTQYEKLKTKP